MEMSRPSNKTQRQPLLDDQDLHDTFASTLPAPPTYQPHKALPKPTFTKSNQNTAISTVPLETGPVQTVPVQNIHLLTSETNTLDHNGWKQPYLKQNVEGSEEKRLATSQPTVCTGIPVASIASRTARSGVTGAAEMTTHAAPKNKQKHDAIGGETHYANIVQTMGFSTTEEGAYHCVEATAADQPMYQPMYHEVGESHGLDVAVAEAVQYVELEQIALQRGMVEDGEVEAARLMALSQGQAANSTKSVVNAKSVTRMAKQRDREGLEVRDPQNEAIKAKSLLANLSDPSARKLAEDDKQRGGAAGKETTLEEEWEESYKKSLGEDGKYKCLEYETSSYDTSEYKSVYD